MPDGLFKGLALFTPGGDVVYCITNEKQDFWHIHLCMELKLLLNLSEAPHFLIPGYTATIDRYFDKESNIINTLAECYPTVAPYQVLLNVIFDFDNLPWQIVPWQEELSSPIIFESYRHQFPQLWEYHNLIVRCYPGINQRKNDLLDSSEQADNLYLFYLFISQRNQGNDKILENVYNFLENRKKKIYTLKIISIEENFELVENYHVSAIPTLIRVSPQPIKRIVGNLEDTAKVLSMFND
jgi:circadian clock protein KaiB